MRNPFEQRTLEDRKRTADLLSKSSEDYNETILAARECMKLEQFKNYQKRCNDTARTLFDLFLMTPSTDVLTETIRVKINAMRLLGVDVLSFANLELRSMKAKDGKSDANA